MENVQVKKDNLVNNAVIIYLELLLMEMIYYVVELMEMFKFGKEKHLQSI